MNIHKILIILMLVAVSVFTGCRERGIKGSGEVITEEREIEEFSRIEVSGAYNINIVVGDRTSLSIAAEDNLQRFITTEVVNDKLIIKNTHNILPKRKIIIDISTNDLEEIISSGISNIYAERIDEQNFSVDLRRAGVIELFGKVENFDAYIYGAALLDSKEFFARFVDIDIEGSARAEAYVSEKLTVELSGNGSIDYYGDPLEVVVDNSGVGSVNKKDY